MTYYAHKGLFKLNNAEKFSDARFGKLIYALTKI